MDSANIDMLKQTNNLFEYQGVTTNPTIIKKEGKVNFFNHLNEIKNINSDGSLHVQVVQDSYEGIIEDASEIVSKLGRETYIKVPVNSEGLRAIKTLKEQKYLITATAIYSEFQAQLAIQSGADMIAPYFNRMENLDKDATLIIKRLRDYIDNFNFKTQILAASFKNINQITDAIGAGAHLVTFDPSFLLDALANVEVQKAVDDFSNDWMENYSRSTIKEQ